jgi:26S proteasome regulatory subunit N10
MPEACFLCVDTTEYMRNGDYFPNRLMAVQEASSILLSAKMQQNQENTLGYLTFGGTACTVKETLTADLERILARMTQMPVSGTVPHFSNALLIAGLALNHRPNQRAEKRIIAFVGSPLTEDAAALEKLAKKLRKDDVAVDVISIGVDSNRALLEGFISSVNKSGNSRLLAVPTGSSVVNVLYTSAILLGNDAVATDGGASEASGGGVGGGLPATAFGVDPNMDPELAMAIRLSLEEERRRAEQEAATATAAPQPAAAPPVTEEAPVLDEQAELELALRMSMEQYAAPDSSASGAAVAPPQPAAPTSQQAQFTEAIADDDFLKELQDAINQNAAGGPPSDPGDKK